MKTHPRFAAYGRRPSGARARQRSALVITVLAALLVAAPLRAQPLTLEEAVGRSAKSHERAQLSALRVRVAEAELDGARSEFFPSLTLGASATLAPDDDGRYISGAGTLTLRQPILAPSALPRLWSAEHSLEAERLLGGEDDRGLAFETARAFLDALAAQRIVDAADARVAGAKANQANAESRVLAELNSSNDLTRAKLEVSSAAREAAQRRRDLARAKLDLGLLMGGEVEGELASPENMFAASRSFAGDPGALAASAASGRSDVRAFQEQVLAARESAKEPLYRLIPSIDLVGQVRANPDPLPDQPWHTESATLSLTWVIFDGGTRYADRDAQLARAESVELSRSLLTRTLVTEVRSAMVGLNAAREAYSIAEETRAAAQANTEETRALYQQGLARAIELVDANAEQFQAEVNLVSSKIEMARSYLEVRAALGLPPTDDDAQSARESTK